MQTHTHLIDHNHSRLIDLHLTRNTMPSFGLARVPSLSVLADAPVLGFGSSGIESVGCYVCMYVCMYACIKAIHLVDWGKIPTGGESVLAADVESAACLSSPAYHDL